jgi:hypothetical protein
MIRGVALVVLLLAGAVSAQTTPHPDARICGTEPTRDPDGRISRSSIVLRAFQIIHPCPATGSRTGPCPGWAIDHVIPLACGGCDSIENLQWLKNSIKSCPGTECKDRWERAINCLPPAIVK